MAESATSDVFAFAQREFTTVIRTPALLVLALGYAVVVLGIAFGATTGGGYLPLALDLLVPMELVVPVLAFAFGYRAILGDRERGELAVIRTYPTGSWTVIAGVYLGRATALAAAMLPPLLVASVSVPGQSQERISLLAGHATTDSPALYFRFIVIAVLFGLVVLAVALGVSAVAQSVRQALAVGSVVVLAVAIGIDVSLVAGLTSGLVPASVIEALVPLSPSSAFRGLVMTYVVSPASSAGLQTGLSPLVATASLTTWALGSLGVARWSLSG